jgi:anti-anti-sigma factor
MTAKVKLEEKDNNVIMQLSGDFNGPEENESLMSTFKELAKKKVAKVAIDLQDVFYLNSASLGTFMSGNALIKKNEGKIAFYNASDYIMNIFSITKLTLTVPVYNSLEEALAFLNE